MKFDFKKKFDLTGKVAIVTGASAGIGIELATTLAEAGADVAVCARSMDKLEEVAKTISNDTGRICRPYSLDLLSEESIKECVGKVKEDFGGRIDILVNNAGFIAYGQTHEMSLEDWNKCLNTDLTGPFLMMKEVGNAAMLEQGSGHIVNITSVSVFSHSSASAVYSAAKAGLTALTRSTAAAWAEHGIYVNCLAPGTIRTGKMSEGMSEELTASVNVNIPQGRLGDYGDLSGAVLFLCSDACSYCQGTTIVADGGMLIESF